MTEKIQPAICVSPCGQKYPKIHKKYDKSLPATPMLCSRETTKHIVHISGVLPDNMRQTTDNGNSIQGKHGKQV